MDKVYFNSYCNLSVADASDSTEGLFRSRQPQFCGPINFKADLSRAEPDTEPVDYVLHEGIFWRRHVLDAKLNSRGWVFQERLLAPRILHFCRYQLFWECRELGACETSPEEMSSRVSQGHDMKKVWQKNASNAADFYLSFWYRQVVGYYANMDLSVPSDKPIALSGIAKHIMPHNGDTYVAGMWRKSLGTHLFWAPMPDPRTSRPQIYRAPTWSWASLDEPITFMDFPEEECLVQVEDVSLQYETEDITGAVTSGWLDLRGSLKPMKLCPKVHVYPAGEQFVFPPVNIAVVVDGALVCSNDNNGRETWRGFPWLYFDTPVFTETAFNDDSASGNLFFKPYRLGRAVPGELEVGVQVACLMLRLVDKERKLFERIGFVKANSYQGKDQLLVELDEEKKTRLPCLRYENGLHTIRII
ncbi:hypothetical protein BKA58DRAFT_401133 [Alternaria rosae]|uniref:uncharacterized protein n=1 Tax=Alternaria rosae TaxID=1187941 RepID=UPI001E8D4929|nr:uncharacterized protein BKA58DRAFT_401133 [Alternaria rosae]KAH6872968.1 hypothetical protein BKA58DRAFT_401133 [Alternaria rosae]